MDCNVCNNRTKALLVFTFQCYIICTFPADGSLYCQSDSVWTNLNDFLGSIKLAIFVVLRHLGILNPLSAPLQDLSLKNIRNHPLSTPLHYPYGLPAPWRALVQTNNLIGQHTVLKISWKPFDAERLYQIRVHRAMLNLRLYINLRRVRKIAYTFSPRW